MASVLRYNICPACIHFAKNPTAYSDWVLLIYCKKVLLIFSILKVHGKLYNDETKKLPEMNTSAICSLCFDMLDINFLKLTSNQLLTYVKQYDLINESVKLKFNISYIINAIRIMTRQILISKTKYTSIITYPLLEDLMVNLINALLEKNYHFSNNVGDGKFTV